MQVVVQLLAVVVVAVGTALMLATVSTMLAVGAAVWLFGLWAFQMSRQMVDDDEAR